jgi:hypothetical protein
MDSSRRPLGEGPQNPPPSHAIRLQLAPPFQLGGASVGLTLSVLSCSQPASLSLCPLVPSATAPAPLLVALPNAGLRAAAQAQARPQTQSRPVLLSHKPLRLMMTSLLSCALYSVQTAVNLDTTGQPHLKRAASLNLTENTGYKHRWEGGAVLA